MNYTGAKAEHHAERLSLYNMDCMELLKQTPDNYYDLAICDVPYGIGESGKTNKSRGCKAKAKDYKSFAGDDLEAPDENYFYELRRVSKNQILWGANHFIDNMGVSLSSPCWIVWDKDNGATDFADCELAWTSFKSAVRKIKFKWQGMLQENMRDKETRIHPCQKPVKLYEWLLQNYSEKGQKILDTHLGSMSIAIACHYFGVHLTGCELDEDYFKAGIQRIENETRQLTLF